MKIKEIASRVGIGRRTAQSWLAHAQYPETNYHHRHRSRFDGYVEYVKRRWDQGCHNIEQLWREIKAASDIPIPPKRCEPISNHFMAKGKPTCQKPPPWTIFLRRRLCGSLSVMVTISMRRSEKNWRPFVRQVRRLRPSTTWFKRFYRWFASFKGSNLRAG